MTVRRGGARPRVARAAAAFATVLSAAGVAACASLPKDRLEQALLDLPKNAPVRAAGLSRRPLTVRLGGGDVVGELTYLRVPARTPADPPLPPVVFVHGTPATLFTWTPLLFGTDTFEGLAAELRDRDLYALEVIGHGVTRTEFEPVTFQACADWVAGALAALGLHDVVLVGNSYGGEFVWRAALDHPDLVGRVVLVDTSGHPRADDEWLPEEEAMREMSLAYVGWVLNSRDRIRGALAPHFPAGVGRDQVEEAYLCCSNSANWRAMVDLARDESGARAAELHALRQPTLLVWGEEDVAYPVERFARLFERDIPGARLELVPGAGHYPQESRPAEVARILTRWLAAQGSGD